MHNLRYGSTLQSAAQRIPLFELFTCLNLINIIYLNIHNLTTIKFRLI